MNDFRKPMLIGATALAIGAGTVGLGVGALLDSDPVTGTATPTLSVSATPTPTLPEPLAPPTTPVKTLRPTSTQPKPPPPATTPPRPQAPALTPLVERLRNGEEETGGYDRQEFGPRAPTATTRQRLLDGERRADGSWYSKWDGKVWRDKTRLDADHTVALAEAWSSGAMHWTYEKRVRFANDLTSPFTLNLITDTLNQGAKSDNDPFDWMPDKNRCQYVREWTSVKLAWNLTADGEEKMALHNAAVECDRA